MFDWLKSIPISRNILQSQTHTLIFSFRVVFGGHRILTGKLEADHPSPSF
ncbi:hypothetical protein M8C21_014645 [Ambrosia artemisiifolia]|uniref:Uncharacterized protein n=1 Tax=Ambrosia artemisiifolia TaxID=4212 RepID=A0AAD5BLC2_AMBAR|nr:hypothetical protein M8C21_014645 [Ambrosia artemisiifolia]